MKLTPAQIKELKLGEQHNTKSRYFVLVILLFIVLYLVTTGVVMGLHNPVGSCNIAQNEALTKCELLNSLEYDECENKSIKEFLTCIDNV